MFKPLDKERTGELSPAQLEDARLGFNQLLRRHMSPQWIERHGEDLFAKALVEYSRKLEEGQEIHRPGAFIVTCAWQRTKSALEAEHREPQLVSTDLSGPLAADLEDGPEEQTLTADRLNKVQDAVAHLSEDQRRLLELAYFEDMSVREAGRQLNWHSAKAQRCDEAARRRLHELLGVDSLDELEIVVGLAAYLSIVEKHSTFQLPAGVEAVAHDGGEKVRHFWNRGEELIARFLSFGGGEPSGVALGGVAGRAAGVCAAAAIACFASGVVGPGIGGLIQSDGGPGPARSSHRQIVSRPPAPAKVAPPPTTRTRPPSALPQHVHRNSPIPVPGHGESSGAGEGGGRRQQTGSHRHKEAGGHHRKSRQAKASKLANATLGVESAASPAGGSPSSQPPPEESPPPPEESAPPPEESPPPEPEPEPNPNPTKTANGTLGVEGAAK